RKTPPRLCNNTLTTARSPNQYTLVSTDSPHLDLEDTAAWGKRHYGVELFLRGEPPKRKFKILMSAIRAHDIESEASHDAQLIANKRCYAVSPTLAVTSAELFRLVFVP